MTDDTQAMSVRLPRDLYEWLRREAFERREHMNAIVIRALDVELLDDGQPDPLTGPTSYLIGLLSGMGKIFAPSEREWQEYQRCIREVCDELTALKWPRVTQEQQEGER